MKKEELEQCGCWFDDTGKCITDDIDLNEFAKLVAEKEREACAKLCEDDDSNAGEWHWEAHVGGYFAKAIRARRQE